MQNRCSRALTIPAVTLSIFVLAVVATGLSPAAAQENEPYLVKDLSFDVYGFQPAQLTPFGDDVVFRSYNGQFHGDFDMAISDGTARGTSRLGSFSRADADAEPFAVLGDWVIFPAAQFGETPRVGLWRTDGSPEGTEPIPAPGGGYLLVQWDVAIIGDVLYFPADDQVNGIELWRTDGTGEGTAMVRNLVYGGGGWPKDLINFNGTLFFEAEGPGPEGRELWKSDGTADGTMLVKDINPGYADADIKNLTVCGDKLYFVATHLDYGQEPWVSDGTESGTYLLRDIYPDTLSSYPQGFKCIDQRVFFIARDAEHGTELWVTEGTTESTHLVLDIRTGTAQGAVSWQSFPPVVFQGQLYFVAYGDDTGAELWATDGTSEHTRLVKDIAPGLDESFPGGLITAASSLYFVADDGVHGRELWTSDGTEAGTRLVADINPAGDAWYFASPLQRMAVVCNRLYFAADDGTHGSELWALDLDDDDCDGVRQDLDNCPDVPNPHQADCNWTGVGDACEPIPQIDFDDNGRVDYVDAAGIAACIGGPGAAPSPGDSYCVNTCRLGFDLDGNERVDLKDYQLFQIAIAEGSGCFTEPGPKEDCNGNEIPDGCDVAFHLSADCNANAVPDECDLASGTSLDCNHNDVPEECDLAAGLAADCNDNGVADCYDLAAGTSADCNENLVPDECDLAAGTSVDCNDNGVPDACDIAQAFSPDCNDNQIPDECDTSGGPSVDCNGNGVPDSCDVASGAGPDCNANGVLDDCDLLETTSTDCNQNHVPDECDVASGAGPDCNANGVLDDCDLLETTSSDCNQNHVPDECDLASATSLDCNGNLIPDECDIRNPAIADCNENAIPDDCDLQTGASRDCNGNGVPEECDWAAGVVLDCNLNNEPDTCDIVDGASEDCDNNAVPDDCQLEQDRKLIADSFEGAGFAFDYDTWPTINGPGVVPFNGPPDGLQVARFRSHENLESKTFFLSDAPWISLNFFIYSVGVDSADAFQVSYWDGLQWQIAGEVVHAGPVDAWEEVVVGFPPEAMNPEFRVRLASVSTSIFDFWYVDMVTLSTSPDIDENGTLDVCDLLTCDQFGKMDEDCNHNGFRDYCDLVRLDSADCNANHVPDECDIDTGTSEDCNGNGVPDECDTAGPVQNDCNANGVPDECDVLLGSGSDCNHNGTLDDCELLADDPPDCNTNGVIDECEIAGGLADDCDGDERPDDCQFDEALSALSDSFELGKIDTSNWAAADGVVYHQGERAYDGEWFVRLDGADRMESVAIDLSAAPWATLSFWSADYAVDANSHLRFKVWDGAQWHTFNELGVANSSAEWRHVQFGIPDLWLNGQLRLAIECEVGSDATEWWIDDLELVSVRDANGDGVLDDCHAGIGDWNHNGWIDAGDYSFLWVCLAGPNEPTAPPDCAFFDYSADGAIDLSDFAAFQIAFTGTPF